MKARLKLSLCALVLMSTGMASQAQQQPQPAQPAQKPAQVAAPRGLSAQQQAALDKQDQDIAQAALNIVRMIDQGKTSEVWDDASPVAKRIISHDDFQRRIASDRALLGTPGMRMPLGVKHLRYDGSGNLPAGAYINVSFDTQFSKHNRSALEMVTLILDSDNIWRFAGYTVR